MGESNAVRIMLAGGGTGGHVYPLLAIVEALCSANPAARSWSGQVGEPSSPGLAQDPEARLASESNGPGARPRGLSPSSARPSETQWSSEQHYEFYFLGSERSESRIVPQFAQEYGVPIAFHQVDIRFSYRLPTPRNWPYYRRHILPLLAGRPFRQAREVLEEVRPSLVLASGGYVSAPTLWAAQQLGIPYALLQLDAAVGVVNKYFARDAARVYVSTGMAAKRLASETVPGRVLVSGFPARRARVDRTAVFAQYGFDPQRRLFTIMGGSLGTGAIAGLAAVLIARLDESPYADKLAVLFSAGERMDTANAIRDKGTQRLQFAAVDYIGDSVSVLAASDFYMGRSGASTVAEIVATGVQSLLIPDPQHRDRQQYLNAQVLLLRGQGEVLEQRFANAEAALEWIERAWIKPRAVGPDPPAAEVIADDLKTLLH